MSLQRVQIIGITVALTCGGGATLCCFPISPPPSPDPVDPGPWGTGGLPDPWGETGGVAGGGGTSGSSTSSSARPEPKFPACRNSEGVTPPQMRAAQVGNNRQFGAPTRDRTKQGLLDAPITVTGSSVLHRSNDWSAYDQGSSSMCTCADASAVASTAPYTRHMSLGDVTACYAAATRIDHGCDYDASVCDGSYPPVDEGSYGWAALQAAVKFGWFTGARPVTQTVQGWHDALLLGPCLFDQNWYYEGYSTDECGQVKASGKLLGGHSTAMIGFDVPNQRMWGRNSWGDGYGVERGYFFYTVDTLRSLWLSGASMYCPAVP